MDPVANKAERPAVSWRLKSGVAIFALSIILPIVGLILVASLGLSTGVTASVSGALLLISEALGVSSIAIMGKPGYLYLKSRAFGFVKQYGPPKEVSRHRYNIGLVLFCIPILFAWVSVYVDDLIPGLSDYPIIYALGGDFIWLASLFVLGGDFWAKIRALFVYTDKICSSKSLS